MNNCILILENKKKQERINRIRREKRQAREVIRYIVLTEILSVIILYIMYLMNKYGISYRDTAIAILIMISSIILTVVLVGTKILRKCGL